jgi:chemotaxis protein MotB
MSKQTWVFVGIFSAGIIIAVLALSAYQQKKEYDHLQVEFGELRHASTDAAAQSALLKAELTQTKEQIERLQKEKDEATHAQKNLEKEMRTALESKDITISQLQGKLTVNILDRVLFDSGQAVLKPEGEQVLQKVAEVLAQYPNRQVHVIGHTDNMPIRANARNPYSSNWELSTARATAAVRYLIDKGNFDPRRLGALGYGEFHPIADNSTPEGRAKNRRIAIVVLPEEFAPSDVTENDAAAKQAAASAKSESEVGKAAAGPAATAESATNKVSETNTPASEVQKSGK